MMTEVSKLLLHNNFIRILQGSGGLCEAKDWEEFFKLHGRCTVQLEFYYVAIALTGLGLLLLFVIVQGIIIMIFIHYACKHGRLKKSYDLDTNGTQKGLYKILLVSDYLFLL